MQFALVLKFLLLFFCFETTMLYCLFAWSIDRSSCLLVTDKINLMYSVFACRFNNNWMRFWTFDDFNATDLIWICSSCAFSLINFHSYLNLLFVIFSFSYFFNWCWFDTQNIVNEKKTYGLEINSFRSLLFRWQRQRQPGEDGTEQEWKLFHPVTAWW